MVDIVVTLEVCNRWLSRHDYGKREGTHPINNDNI
jgi:hypothetical protein